MAATTLLAASKGVAEWWNGAATIMGLADVYSCRFYTLVAPLPSDRCVRRLLPCSQSFRYLCNSSTAVYVSFIVQTS